MVADTVAFLETAIILQNTADVIAGAMTHAGDQATIGIVVTLWIAVPVDDPEVVDVPAAHGPGVASTTTQRSRNASSSPTQAGGSLSSQEVIVDAISSASHRRFWAGSSAGGAAAISRLETAIFPTLIVENSRRQGYATGHRGHQQRFRLQDTTGALEKLGWTLRQNAPGRRRYYRRSYARIFPSPSSFT